MAAHSFSSFPDLDPGPSTRPSSRQDGERDRGRAKHDEDKEEDRHARRKRSSHDHKPAKDYDNKRREKDRNKDKDKDRDRRRDRDKDRHRDKDSNRQHKQEREREPPATVSALYISDRRGDPFNVTYGGIHAASVPRYYRARKTVLGMPYAFKITSDRGKGLEIGFLGKRRPRRYTDQHALASLRSSQVHRVIKPTGRPLPRESEEQGFIPLSKSRQKEPRASTFHELLMDAEKASSASSESEESGDSSDEEDIETTLTADQEAIKALEAAISVDPASLSSWFSLLSLSLATIPHDSKNATKARAEITLAVFSRALKAHDSNGTSARFRVTYLRSGESVWSADQLYHEWEDALRVVANKSQIWLAWYTWRLRVRMRAGEISGVADDASRALRALANSELARVGILWRSAVFLKEAGFHERATAVLQAQAELSFFCPQTILGAAFESQLPSLEEFWDSEVPRVGEANAKGWAASLPLPEEPPSLPYVASRVDTAVDSDPYMRWYSTERRLDSQLVIPARTSSDTDDPYATVLFSDLRGFLSPIRSKEGCMWLRYAWLSVLGLHIPGLSAAFDLALANNVADDVAEPSDSWMLPLSDTLIQRLFPASMRGAEEWDAVAGVIVAKVTERKAVFGPVKEWALGTLRPLEGTGSRGEGRMWEVHDVEGLDHSIIRNFFDQTRKVSHDEEWDVLSIAFEAALSPKSAVKLSKALLSQAPNSLCLWSAHARLERIRGRNDEARKVYQANLGRGAGQAGNASAALRSGEAEMWWEWAEMEWLDGHADASLHVIHSACGVDFSGGVGVLRVKRALDHRVTTSSSSSSSGFGFAWSDLRAWICIRALFELLTTGSVMAALSISASAVGQQGRSDNEREALEISLLLLIYHHAHTLRVPSPPAVLREHVEGVLARYPENTLVLGVFLEAERGQAIWGRVRQLYGESSKGARPKRLIRRAWDVWAAGRDRGNYDGERVRQILDAAGSQIGASPMLWRLFINLEIRLERASQARNLLLRAVGDCPWAKDLHMLAYGPLRRSFTSDELNRWTESMAERGLRIRLELDQYIQGWEGSQSDDDDSQGAADSDIEHNAHELRRLMPY